MTLQKLKDETGLNLSLQTLRKIIKENREHFKGAVMVLENSKRTTFRVLDKELFLEKITEL